MSHIESQKIKLKLFNYRATVICLIACIFAIILAGILTNFIFCCVAGVVCVFACTLIAIFRNKIKHFSSLIVALILFVACLFGMTWRITGSHKSFATGVSGIDCEIGIEYVSSNSNTILGTITVGTNTYDGLCIVNGANYGIDLSMIDIGDKLTANVVIEDVIGERGQLDYNTDYFVKNIRYSIYIEDIVALNKNNVSLSNKLKLDLRDILYKYLDDDTASVSTALLLGDKYGISDDNKVSYSNSGLSHVLAISGLHVIVFASAVLWLCKKLKVKYSLSVIISIIFAFSYVALGGFSPSGIRAIIMYVCLNVAKCGGKQQDSLSSLSLAGIIILLINQMYLFDLSFLMSFSAVLGIIIFGEQFSKSISKILPKPLSDIIAISLAVNICMLPIMANCFGKISVIALLSNVLVLPIMSILLSCLMLSMVLATILPWLGLLFYVPSIMVHYVDYVAYALGNTILSSIRIANIGALTIPYYGGIVLSSDFCNLPNKYKEYSKLISVIIAIVAVAVCTIGD